MLKKNIVFISTMLLAGVALSVSAQTAGTPVTTTERKEDTRTISTTSSAKRLEAARKQLTMTTARLNAALDRVQTLADRTNSRLLKLSTEGGNVAVSRQYLANAKVKLDEARAKIAIAKAAGDAALTATQPTKNNAAMKKVESFVKDATKTIQAAQNLVAKAIANLKPGYNKQSTTTRSTN